ncbi:hypothetical protein VTO42DRAFT_2793 [Malbranchea cinnamomea]
MTALTSWSPMFIEGLSVILVSGVVFAVGGTWWIINQRKPWRQVRKQVLLTTQNTVFGGLGTMVVAYLLNIGSGIPVLERTVTVFDRHSLPSVATMVRQTILSALMFDVMFYVLHRLMHTPLAYRRFHRVHHEFRDHTPLAVGYVHPVDYFWVQIFPLLLSARIQKGHLVSLLVAGGVAQAIAMLAHADYTLPLFMAHQGHHRSGKHNFGAVGIMDYMFGTLY